MKDSKKTKQQLLAEIQLLRTKNSKLTESETKHKQTEKVLESIATQFSNVSGQDFFEDLCMHITKTLHIDYAFIGEFLANENKVRVKAAIGKGKSIKPFDYDLTHTPCEKVIGKTICSYPSNVQEQFPKDHLLVEMDVHSYLGIPLFSRNGDALGIMVMLNKTPIKNENILIPILQIFSNRVSIELEQLQTEDALRESEERFRGLSEAAFDAIFISENGICIEQNSAAEKMFGYTLDEAIGMKGTEWIVPEDREMVLNKMLSGDENPYEARALRKDGSTFPVEIIGKMMNYKGRYVRVTALNNITKRKQAEEQLRKNKTLLQTLVETIPDLVWVKDLNGVYLSCNQRFEKFFGASSSEIVGKTDYDFIDKKLADFFRQKDNEAITAGKPSVNEEEVIFADDGHHEILETIKTPMHDADGKIIGVLGVGRDITERKKGEQELRQSELRFKQFYESLGDAVFVTKIGGKNRGSILEVNPAAIAQTGYSRDELLNMNIIRDLYISGSCDINTDDWEKELLRGKTVTATEKKRKKNGSEYWTEVIGTPIEYLGKKAALSINHDITKRKLAENKLKESEEYFRMLIENSNDVISILNEKGNIIFESQSHERVLGYKAGELIGKNAFEYVHPEDRKRISKQFKDLLKRANDIELVNFRFLHKDGSWRFIEGAGKNLLNTPNIKGVVVNYRDVSERILTQEALKESEEKYRNLYSSANDAIILMYKNRFISCNPKTLEMFDCKEEEILGFTPSDFSPKYQSDGVASTDKMGEKFNTALKGDPQSFEWIHQRKNGTQFYAEVSLNKIVLSDGEFIQAIVRDITERKKAEEAIRESEERYRNFVANASEGIYRIDFTIPIPIDIPDKKLITLLNKHAIIAEVNEALAKMYGLKPEDMIGRKVIDFAPEYGKRALLVVRAPQFKVTDIETLDLDKDGNHVYLSENFNAVIKDGFISRIWGMQRNITESKWAADALRKSEETYRITSEKTGQLVYDYNPETGEIIWAGAIKLITGYTTEEFQMVDIDAWVEMIHPDDREIILKKLDIAEKHCSNFDVDYRFLQKDGSYIHVEDHGVFLPDDNGKTNRMLGSIIDITDRKEAQKALQESEKRFKDLVGMLPESVFETDITFKLTYVNNRALELFGYSEQEFKKGINGLDLLVPEDQERAIANFRLRMNGEDPGIIQYQAVKKDGSVIQILFHANSIIKDGKLYGLRGIIIDVTKQKENEKTLKEALLKATESDRLKSAFLATMSHELRTPLNAVIGFSDIINEDLPLDDILSYTKTINSSGTHLLNIVNDLFDITLIESGQTKIHKRDENLDEILNDVHEIVKAEQLNINKTNLDLKLQTPSGNTNLIINTDPSKLKQILINLIKNALKFTNEGHVKYGYSIEKNHNKNLFKFYVEDTGIGIPGDKKEFIFDIFRQAQESYTKTHGGTGIGLTISKKLVELLGGNIWLNSVEENLSEGQKGGTTFYFTIPYADQKFIATKRKSEISAQEQATAILKNKTVLIVEDIEPSYEYLKIVLEQSGMNTLWAINGEEAIKQCRENESIDLVLMDINMPIMNGYEATKQIKELKPQLPIIAQTAYAISGDREKALDAGCDDYISKPFNKSQLIQLINSYFCNEE